MFTPFTGRTTQFSKQHSALFWRCERSERICRARTVTKTAVVITAVEKRLTAYGKPLLLMGYYIKNFT